MNNNEEPETESQIVINFNLIKFNSYAVIAAVFFSFFKDNNNYINAVYNSLIIITIYTNLLFIYILYINRNKL